MAARLFVPVVVAGTLGGGVGPLWGQRVELRGGAALSSALAHDAIAAGAGAVTVRARPGALLGAVGLVPLRERLALEVGAAAALSRLRAADPSGTRDVQSLTVGQAQVGVRWSAPPGAYLRGSVGAVKYFSPDGSIFAGGSAARPALEAGVGWTRSAGAWRVGGEVGGQVHGFDTPALDQAGGSSGGVRRAFALLTLSREVRR